MKTSKSPAAVLAVAHLIGESVLAVFAHRFSPKKFTQPQLFACLVLKEFLQLDYRKLAAVLEDASDLRNIIELKTTPHFSTFQKAAQRLLSYGLARALQGFRAFGTRFAALTITIARLLSNVMTFRLILPVEGHCPKEFTKCI